MRSFGKALLREQLSLAKQFAMVGNLEFVTTDVSSMSRVIFFFGKTLGTLLSTTSTVTGEEETNFTLSSSCEYAMQREQRDVAARARPHIVVLRKAKGRGSHEEREASSHALSNVADDLVRPP